MIIHFSESEAIKHAPVAMNSPVGMHKDEKTMKSLFVVILAFLC